jgi:hypothetical protein
MDWATFWAIFSQTHLVTLIIPTSAPLSFSDVIKSLLMARRKIFVFEKKMKSSHEEDAQSLLPKP